MLRADQFRPGVEHQEVAGSVRVLRLAGRVADLPDGGRLLVAEDTGDGNGLAQRPGGAGPSVRLRVGGRVDGGQHGPGYAEEAEQFVVPVEGLQVHEHGAAGVGDVGGVDAAIGSAGEVPQHPAVGVAEEGMALLGGLPHAVDVLQDPLDLAAGEVGGRWQPRFTADDVALAAALQCSGDGVGTGVLPDDGVVVRAAGAGVPDDGRLALVGDADGRQVGGVEVSVPEGVLDHRVGAFPDLHRVVFDPPRAREDLGVLQLVPRHLVAGVVEDHETGARGPLVHCADEVSHGVPPPLGDAVCGGCPSGTGRTG